MADIRITHSHALPLEQARAAAQKIADKLVRDYDMESAWQGNVLSFARSGVSGRLAVSDGMAQLDISLGFLLSALAPTIEQEVGRAMEKAFGAPA